MQDLHQGSWTPKPVCVTTVIYGVTGSSVFKQKTTPKRYNMGRDREAALGEKQMRLGLEHSPKKISELLRTQRPLPASQNVSLFVVVPILLVPLDLKVGMGSSLLFINHSHHVPPTLLVLKFMLPDRTTHYPSLLQSSTKGGRPKKTKPRIFK